MKVIDAISNVIIKIEKFLLVFTLSAIVIATFLEIIGRYTPLPFSGVWDEAASFLFSWSTMIGAGACYREGLHMSMDFVTSFLPKSSKKYLRIIYAIIGIAVCVIIIKAGLKFIPKLYKTKMVSSAMEMPLWIQQSSLLVGCAGMIYWAVVGLIKDIASFFTKKETEVKA